MEENEPLEAAPLTAVEAAPAPEPEAKPAAPETVPGFDMQQVIDRRVNEAVEARIREHTAQRQAPAAPAEDEDDKLAEQLYTDPKGAIRAIREAATRQAMEAVRPVLQPLYQKDAVRQVAGEDAHAREYVQKFVEKGANVNDPEIAELLRRAGRDYSAEKAPKGSVSGVRAEPTATQAPKVSRESQTEMDMYNAILAKHNPKAVLTAKDL